MTEMEVGKRGFVMKLDEETIETIKDNNIHGRFCADSRIPNRSILIRHANLPLPREKIQRVVPELSQDLPACAFYRAATETPQSQR
jgi:hypothetical protein